MTLPLRPSNVGSTRETLKSGPGELFLCGGTVRTYHVVPQDLRWSEGCHSSKDSCRSVPTKGEGYHETLGLKIRPC